jgi:hypothetical protein
LKHEQHGWRKALVTRREFLDTLATGAAGLAIGSTAKSYGQILGSNDRLNFAVFGVHSRAYAHLSSLKANKSAARISHVCDVDSNTLKKFADDTEREMGERPATDKDFRSILQLKEIDAITIAAPDHWHTPMAIAGLQAGKHVYVEKPCSHNPAEGALLVEAQKKYGKQVQMGTQQRSSPHTIEVVDKIHNGLMDARTTPKRGTAIQESPSALARKRLCPQCSIGTYGRVRRRAKLTKTMCSRIAGTGSRYGAPERRSITGLMR